MPNPSSALSDIAMVPSRRAARASRLTLRTMLLVLGLVCLVSGYYANRYHQQRRIIQMVTRNGGQIGYRQEHRYLRLQPRLASLALPKIERVALFFTEVTDAELDVLQYGHALRRLNLAYTSIGDEGLRPLSDLPRLERIDLKQTRVTDAGVAVLSRIRSLQAVILDGTQMSDAGMRHLETLPKLNYLSIRKTAVTEDAARNFQRLHPKCVVMR